MNEWTWSIDGPFSGFIRARTLPNIGSFTDYSPTQIQNSSKIEIMRPNPTISTPSIPKSLWTIPMPNSGDVYFLICHSINQIIAKLFNF